MTRDEAEKIAKLIGFADGGCPACVGALVECANGLGLGYQFERTDEVVSEPWPVQPDWKDPDDPDGLECDRRIVVRVIDPIDKTATAG